MERRAGKEGVPNPWSVPSEESYAGSHRRNYESSTDRGSLLNSFGNEVGGSVVFGDRFNEVGTTLDERIRKLFDSLQHQLQLVFAVVARFVFAAAMTGDRIVGLFLDLGITPLRLDIIAERVVGL
jgi:hypothetical protein